MYIKIDQDKFDYLSNQHEQWLKGQGGVPVSFSCMDFVGIDFRGADLRQAIFHNCLLTECVLIDCKLDNAHMQHTHFKNTNMDRCSCYGADFRYCGFNNVRFCGANLGSADFYMATLRNVDFFDAYTFCTRNFHSVCPEEGSFIGFKRCEDAIVKLQIPEDALRSSATTRKCRCSKAKVLEITDSSGNPWGSNFVSSEYDPGFEYVVGEIAEVPDFDTDKWNECSRGIHFFLTRQEAIDYC